MTEALDQLLSTVDAQRRELEANALRFHAASGGRPDRESRPRTEREADRAAPVPRTAARPFPTVYRDRVEPDARLQAALDSALEDGPGRRFRAPVALVALNPDGSRPLAEFRGSEMHFAASLLKVAALYAVFELKKTLEEVAKAAGAEGDGPSVLAAVAQALKPAILEQARALPALRRVTDSDALPDHASLFDVARPRRGPGLDVSFSAATAERLRHMIAVSDNEAATACIRGVGYGFLAGALTLGGFFDARAARGVWLGGGYTASGPRCEVPSVNDGLVAHATTVRDMARLYTLLADGQLVDAPSSREMAALLTSSVAEREVFTNRGSFLNFSVTHCKIGLGPLKPSNGGYDVYSEGSLLEHESGRRFVAVWQNYVPSKAKYPFDHVAHVLRDAMQAYLNET